MQYRSLKDEVSVLLGKLAITRLPSGAIGQGFYSTYFLILKKDGGLRPILNLRKFNRHLRRLPFRMLCLSTLLTFIRQGDWFTTVDLQDAYFHIPIHKDHKKYLRFYFQGNAYEYNVLPFGLSLAPRTFTKCMNAALIPLRRQGLRIANYLDDWVICSPTEQQARSNTKVVLAHLQKLGLTLNSKKSCLTPTRVVTYLGLNLNSVIMRASLTPQRQSVLKECLYEFLKKDHVTVRLGRRLLGLMAAACAIGVASHAPITAMVSKVHSKSIREWTATGSKRPGLSSSSQVVALNSRPEGGSQAGTVMFKGDHNNRCLTGRLGCYMERQYITRKMGGLVDRRTHKPLGAGGSISGLDTFSSSVSGEAGGCSFRQHNSRVIHKSPGRCTFNIPTQEGSGSPVMGTCSRSVPEGCTLTGRGQCSSRPLVKGGSQARRMATSPSTDTGHLASFREGQSRSFCHTGKHTLSPVVFDGGPQRASRGGCSGKQMAPSTPVCISTFPTAACSPGQGENVEGQSPAGGTRLASTVMDAGSNRFAERVAMASPSQTGHAVSGPRSDLPAEFREVQVARLATRRESARNLGEAVLTTLQAAKAPSTRRLYASRWGRFSRWCQSMEIDPFSCEVDSILLFLQFLLETGVTESTLRGYVAAISDRHEGYGGNTVEFQPLIKHYLKGARRLSPSRAQLIPSWDLGIVLKALTEPPFEPLDEIRMEFFTLKTAFLLAVSSVKRVSEIHAFSVHPACLRLGEEGSSISLLPNPSFLPKVLPRSFVSRPLVLEPFHPPHNSAESARLHLICPVRALRRYISCTQQIRRSDQLFVCYGDSVQGQAVPKQRLAKWVVRLIELAYHSAGMTPPQGVVAHSTRGVATSWALFRGASLDDVCAAAGWSSSMTFVKFYRLDVATTVASTVLQTAEQAWSALCRQYQGALNPLI